MRPRISHAQYLLAGLLAGALPARAACAQDAPFEGIVSFRTHEGEEGGAYTVQQYIRKGAIRIDMPARAQSPNQVVIIDRQKKQMIMFAPGQPMYMQIPIPDSPRGPAEDEAGVQVTKTGKTETVAGYHCEHWLLKDKTGEYDACVTRQLGGFLGMQSPGAGGRSRSAYAEMFEEGAVFPLRVTKVGGGTTFEVTRIEKKALDASLFAPPSGSRKMEMPGARERKP